MLRDQPRDLLGGILEVVIERDYVAVTCLPDSHQEGIVLTKVAHQADASDAGVRRGSRDDDLPAPIRAPVIDEDDLVSRRDELQGGR